MSTIISIRMMIFGILNSYYYSKNIYHESNNDYRPFLFYCWNFQIILLSSMKFLESIFVGIENQTAFRIESNDLPFSLFVFCVVFFSFNDVWFDSIVMQSWSKMRIFRTKERQRQRL